MNDASEKVNQGLNLLNDAVANGIDNMTTFLYAGAVVIGLLALRMVKVSLDNAGCRGRYNSARARNRR